jgi:hypothetical protein
MKVRDGIKLLLLLGATLTAIQFVAQLLTAGQLVANIATTLFFGLCYTILNRWAWSGIRDEIVTLFSSVSLYALCVAEALSWSLALLLGQDWFKPACWSLVIFVPLALISTLSCFDPNIVFEEPSA